MKRTMSLFLITFVLLTFAGVALAAEMSGQVAAVDVAKGAFILKSGGADIRFDCEPGSLIIGMKVGDFVMVQYTQEGGKKKATKITPQLLR